MSECDTIFGCLIILGGGGMNITYSGLIKEASERYFGGTDKFNAPTRYGVVLTCSSSPSPLSANELSTESNGTRIQFRRNSTRVVPAKRRNRLKSSVDNWVIARHAISYLPAGKFPFPFSNSPSLVRNRDFHFFSFSFREFLSCPNVKI